MHSVKDIVCLVAFVLTFHFTTASYKLSQDDLTEALETGGTKICVKTLGNSNSSQLTENGGIENGQFYQKCENTTTTNYCFTVWEVSPVDGSIKVLKQGKMFENVVCFFSRRLQA